MGVVSINPRDFPVRARHPHLALASRVAHVAALLLAVASCFTAAATVPVGSPLLAVPFALVMFAAAVMGVAAGLGVRSTQVRTPRYALVRVAGQRRAVRLRLRLDLDLPSNTYRGYRRGQPWTPPGRIAEVRVNDLVPGQGLAFGEIVVSYEQAVASFLRRRCPTC